MALKNQKKASITKMMSLPKVRSFIVMLGILVALLIGIFTLHAETPISALSMITPEGTRIRHVEVDIENFQVTSAPTVLVYDKNFDLILSSHPGSISQHEKEHLSRLLNICELLMNNDETTIYWLDK